jgi:type IV secretion system protein VirD4
MSKNSNEFLRGKPADASGEQALSIVFKIIALGIIVIGLQIAAQKFAQLTGYDPAWAGNPSRSFVLFGKEVLVYPFYRMFYWPLLFYKRTAIHPQLWAAWKIAIYTSLSAIVFYFFLEFILIRNRRQNIFGTARWAVKKDLMKAGLLNYEGGVVLGQLSDALLRCAYDASKNAVVMSMKKASQKIIQSGIYNTVLSAPTRSGKGVSCVIPTLLSYPGSVIVLDFKGENFNLTSGFRSKFGKVYRWEPTGGKGHFFNPLEEIRSGKDAYSDANLIADILTMPASGGGNATSEHFQVAAKDFLTSVILHVLCCPDWESKSLPGCREFLSQVDPFDPGNNKYVYDLMLNGEHGDPAIHQAIIEGAGAQRKRPDDEGGSVLSTVNNALAVFADFNVRRNCSSSEFYIDEFAETKRPISLYLTIQYSDVARIASLIRMFVILFSRRFTGGETQAANRKFKSPLLFILDEFDKLGKMDELEMNMGIHNGFGIHYFLIFQSLNQLNKIYGKDHAFLAHCRNSIFYAPGTGEYESAELISKVCGRESISKANISYSGSRGALGYNNSSLSSQDQERNLINADEIIKLPLDSFILMCQGLPPYIGKKNVYYQDIVFNSKISYDVNRNPVPFFSTREEAHKIALPTIKKIDARRWYNKSPGSYSGRETVMGDEEVSSMYDRLSGYSEPDDPAEAALYEQDGSETEGFEAPAERPEKNFL